MSEWVWLLIATTTSTTSPKLPPSLRVNFAWTLAGNTIYMGCQWGMLVALAKLGSPEMVGQFAIGLAMSGPVMMFANLQLRAVQATDARGEYSFGNYFGLRVLTTLLALAVIAALAWTGHGTQTAWVILITGVARALDAISDVIYGLMQRHEHMRTIAISMTAKGLLSLPAFALGIARTGSVVWAVAAMAVAWGGVLLAFDLPMALRMRAGSPWHGWEWGKFRKLTRLSLPLGVVMLLLALSPNIPRYFLERFQGERELGIYAALAYIPVAGTAVIGALGQTLTSRLAQYYAARDSQAFVRLLGRAAAIGAALGAAMIAIAVVAGDHVISLVYRSQYAGNKGMLVVLMVSGGIGFVASFLGFGATAARRFRPQLPLLACVALTVLAMSAWLVPGRGGMGAAWALLAGSVVQLVLSAGLIVYAVRGLGRRVTQA